MVRVNTPALYVTYRSTAIDNKQYLQFNVQRSVHRKYIPIYIQQDATLHSLFISGNCWKPYGLTSARCCRYSCMCSWWWVQIPPETCRAVSRNKEQIQLLHHSGR